MPVYYTVDRAGQISADMNYQLDQFDLSDVPDLAQHFSSHYPMGVSRHGAQYLNSKVTAPGGPAVELVWESIRRAHFPHRPSRFTSVFAWQTLDEAKAFQALAQTPAKIWAVEAERGFVANMSLLNVSTSLLRAMQIAELYWEGHVGPTDIGLQTPRWEVLLSLPVKALHSVD
ncbi:DUF2441 domain-containing protein [Cupriavidus sp. IK-TO18]|uniref:DUF2441 domain-containing protein n=1 Tax=Cupriavidus sp. IK-TO18 TaxID=2782182 RepID=UPI001898FC5E|nr:DUF2441 domain-containing protein [Cupriavidus sp. IK-TO18]MBF6989287.1 DUF2441 domain-containing protein [Cupriavidus sp. IK-TO18]